MEKYQRHPNTKCLTCNKPIYRRPSELKRYNYNSYCSKNCLGISCRKENLCLVCRQPILGGLHKKTCSRSCSNESRTGVKYKLNRPKDKAKYIAGLKLRLLVSKGLFCERCGYDKYEILQVHHKDRNRENNELDNLELICPNCHFEEHYLEKSWLKRYNIQDFKEKLTLKESSRKTYYLNEMKRYWLK